MTDRKIFLVQRSFSKEKTSGKYIYPFNKDEDIIHLSREILEEREILSDANFGFKLTELVWLIAGRASLAHVSEEEKCVELSSEELELLKSLLSVTDEVFCPECVKISEALLTKLSKVTE